MSREPVQPGHPVPWLNLGSDDVPVTVFEKSRVASFHPGPTSSGIDPHMRRCTSERGIGRAPGRPGTPRHHHQRGPISPRPERAHARPIVQHDGHTIWEETNQSGDPCQRRRIHHQRTGLESPERGPESRLGLPRVEDCDREPGEPATHQPPDPGKAGQPEDRHRCTAVRTWEPIERGGQIPGSEHERRSRHPVRSVLDRDPIRRPLDKREQP